MTNIWMLSRESMKGMDLLSIAVDVLHAYEQLASDKSALSEKETSQRFDRGSELLSMLEEAAKDQFAKKYPKDLYILKVVEALGKAMNLRPLELAQKFHRGKLELKAKSPSEETIDLLKEFIQIMMGMTSRSVEAVSTTLY